MGIRIVRKSELRKLENFIEEAEHSEHCVYCPWLEGKSEHHPTYEITTKCNLNCVFCYAYSAKIANTLPKPGYYGEIEPKPKAITVSQYGEPLTAGLDKVERVIRTLKRKFGARIDLQTNGTLLTKDTCMNIGADLVMISLDAASRENYLRITGKDMFFRVLDALKYVKNGIIRTVYLPGINDFELESISRIAFENEMDFMLQPCSVHAGLKERLELAGYDFERDTVYDYLSYVEKCNAKLPACFVENIKKMLEVVDFEEVAFIRRQPVKKPPEIRRKWKFVID